MTLTAEVSRPHKARINVCVQPDVLDLMTEVARKLHCSRSELLEYCFRLWYSQRRENFRDVEEFLAS